MNVKAILFSMLLAFSGMLAQAQCLVKDYPEGYYYSYEDFVAKKVRPAVTIERRTIFGNRIIHKDTIANQVFFYRVKDTLKVDDIFAISYRGNLYFRQREMSKHAKKGDRDQSGANPNSYHRVIKDGAFFYMEGSFGSSWAKGAAYGVGGAAGGAVGASINQLKGVIYDPSAKKFDFFRKCKDFQGFLNVQAYNSTVDCDNYDIRVVREIIDKIIK